MILDTDYDNYDPMICANLLTHVLNILSHAKGAGGQYEEFEVVRMEQWCLGSSVR